MKKLILTGLSLLFAATLTFAQEINPETKAKEVTIELTEKLSLSEAQQASIYTLVLDKTKLTLSLEADTQLPQEEKDKRIAEAKTNFKNKVSELLTEEQNEAFTKYLDEKEANNKEG